MLVMYTVVVSYFNSFGHAVAQFVSLWPLMILLVAGFGGQVGLFFYFKEKAGQLSGVAVASSGTMSTGSMVACCAHHISDVLPLMGLPFLAAFAVRYQVFFISLGAVSNVLGMLFLLKMMHSHKLRFGRKSVLGKLMRYDMDRTFKISLAAGAVLLLSIFIVS